MSRNSPSSGLIVARSGRQIGGIGEQVRQGAALGARRVRPLGGLVELLRVAEQHDGPRGGRAGEHVGEAHLAGLVDDEDVQRGLGPRELGPAPRPGHGADDVDRCADRSAASTSALPLSTIAAAWVGRLAALRLLADADGPAELDGGLGHLVEHLPDDLVAVGDDADAFPLGRRGARSSARPVYVLPEPGGPWIGRTPPGIARTIRVAASTAVSPGRRSGAPGPCPTSGGVRSSRSRTEAGTAPPPSVAPPAANPASATRCPVRRRLSASSPLGTTPCGTIDRGSATPARIGPRLIVMVCATSSTASTVPAPSPVRGSSIVGVLADPVVLGRERERVGDRLLRPARCAAARARRAARAPRSARRRSCPSARSSATTPTCPRAGARSASGRGASGRRLRAGCARSTGSSGTPAVRTLEIRPRPPARARSARPTRTRR